MGRDSRNGMGDIVAREGSTLCISVGYATHGAGFAKRTSIRGRTFVEHADGAREPFREGKYRGGKNIPDTSRCSTVPFPTPAASASCRVRCTMAENEYAEHREATSMSLTAGIGVKQKPYRSNACTVTLSNP